LREAVRNQTRKKAREERKRARACRKLRVGTTGAGVDAAELLGGGEVGDELGSDVLSETLKSDGGERRGWGVSTPATNRYTHISRETKNDN